MAGNTPVCGLILETTASITVHVVARNISSGFSETNASGLIENH